MVRSMTGYGRGGGSQDGYSLTVEIKSINHRHFDLVIRAPRELLPLEGRIRRKFHGRIYRGRVEIYVNLEATSEPGKIVDVDINLAESYCLAIQKLENYFQLAETKLSMGVLAGFPDIFKIIKADPDLDKVAPLLELSLDEAIVRLIEQRAEEGRRLEKDIVKRLGLLRELVLRMREKGPVVLEEYRARLNSRLEEILGGKEFDKQRFSMEVALFAEKSNIDEELIRLESHLESFSANLGNDEAVGRKLDFLLQEMNREINTIASKSSDLEISQLVVEGKSEIEKIREQIQNIE
ncbi:MAG TPA: YicC family protein [Firmicutes bacterium]|nr:YicC family protein [Bacillota bacterium]